MTIAQYIESIANQLSVPNTFLQGKAWEVNIDVDQTTIFPVVEYGTYLQYSVTRGKDGKARFEDYPVVIRFHLLQDELDMESKDIDTEIFTQLEPLGQEFEKRIYNSSQYQVVAQQSDSQLFNYSYFRDETDEITAGLQLSGTIRLRLQETFCV